MDRGAQASFSFTEWEDDDELVRLAKNGNAQATKRLIVKYQHFVRMKANSYFIAGGDAGDLIQEGYIGLYKAIRDYRYDRPASFRSFAELCVTRQIITAIKTASRQKHSPLNPYISFSHSPAGRTTKAHSGRLIPSGRTSDPVSRSSVPRSSGA